MPVPSAATSLVRLNRLLHLELLDPIRVNDSRAVVGLASCAILALGQEGTDLVPFVGDVKMAARPRQGTARPVFLEPPAACVNEVPLSDPASLFDSANFDLQE